MLSGAGEHPGHLDVLDSAWLTLNYSVLHRTEKVQHKGKPRPQIGDQEHVLRFLGGCLRFPLLLSPTCFLLGFLKLGRTVSFFLLERAADEHVDKTEKQTQTQGESQIQENMLHGRKNV